MKILVWSGKHRAKQVRPLARQLFQRKQDPDPARAHRGQPRWEPAATTPHIRPRDLPGSLHIHGAAHLSAQGMTARV